LWCFASPPAWVALVPAQARRLPAELAGIDAYLDDERFITPWRTLFAAHLGRLSVPIRSCCACSTLKHRYQLGYEGLCREVGDSISWRRFCRIPLDQPVPHPTTFEQARAPRRPRGHRPAQRRVAGKLAGDKLLRSRKLRIDTTVVEADIDYPASLPPRARTRWASSTGRWALLHLLWLVRKSRVSGQAAAPGAAQRSRVQAGSAGSMRAGQAAGSRVTL
jgi:Transposase domain (DUF772)